MTCSNTGTLRDANHALEVSAAAVKIEPAPDHDNIAGSINISTLTDELTIKYISNALKKHIYFGELIMHLVKNRTS